jgi:hypothetical protein
MDQAEQILTTITSSLRILQIKLHDVFFESDGKPKEVRQMEDEFFVYIGPVIFAMNRISSEQYRYLSSPRDFPIEPQLTKLQLELLILCICPVDCLIFRSQLSVITTTAGRSLDLLQRLRERRTYYCVRWINDSVMMRDYNGWCTVILHNQF